LGIDVLNRAVVVAREKLIRNYGEIGFDPDGEKANLSITIVDLPNVEKSSLTNLLLGTSRVIVSETDGIIRFRCIEWLFYLLIVGRLL
jgi:predicted GTPase